MTEALRSLQLLGLKHTPWPKRFVLEKKTGFGSGLNGRGKRFHLSGGSDKMKNQENEALVYLA